MIVEAAFAGLQAMKSRELESYCEGLARQYLEQGSTPRFMVDAEQRSFLVLQVNSDPRLLCADRYWRIRFRKMPRAETAAECADWINVYAAPRIRRALREKWALDFGFITRPSIETPDEIAAAAADIVARNDADSRAYFCLLYHAGKLRGNFHWASLQEFLDSSPLAKAASKHQNEPVYVALRSFAAFGGRTGSTRQALALFEQAWSDPQRSYVTIDVALNGLALGTPFPDQGELLCAYAKQALAMYPANHIFLYRLATGYQLSGDFPAALDAIDDAIAEIPATAWQDFGFVHEQYNSKRELIRNALATERRHSRGLERASQPIAQTAAVPSRIASP